MKTACLLFSECSGYF